jgi:hypothetical protein
LNTLKKCQKKREYHARISLIEQWHGGGLVKAGGFFLFFAGCLKTIFLYNCQSYSKLFPAPYASRSPSKLISEKKYYYFK